MDCSALMQLYRSPEFHIFYNLAFHICRVCQSDIRSAFQIFYFKIIQIFRPRIYFLNRFPAYLIKYIIQQGSVLLIQFNVPGI